MESLRSSRRYIDIVESGMLEKTHFLPLDKPTWENAADKDMQTADDLWASISHVATATVGQGSEQSPCPLSAPTSDMILGIATALMSMKEHRRADPQRIGCRIVR